MIIISVENSWAASDLCGKRDTFNFSGFFDNPPKNLKYNYFKNKAS